MHWEDLLLEAGIEFDASLATGEKADFILSTPEGPWAVEVRRYTRSPRPHELATVIDQARNANHPLLLISDELSETTRQMLADARISYITQHDGVLHVDGKPLILGGTLSHSAGPDASATTTPLAELPWRGRSAFQVLRRLLQQDTPRTQTALAAEAHVSQPRVSQVLATLAEHGLLGSSGELSPAQRGALLDFWIARYPGPGGITTRWYSPAPLNEAVAAASAAADEADADPTLSGTFAADHLAPFARPTHATLYVRRLVDLTVTQMVRTPEPDVATLELVVPDDPTVWRPEPDPPHAEIQGTRVALADALQVAWDIARVGGIDARKQIDRLLERTLHDRVAPT